MDTNSNVLEITKKARLYRSALFEKFLKLGQGHPGSTFSMVDIVTTLFHGKFATAGYDKVIVSKGHATVALYPIMADFGVLPEEEWDQWGVGESILRVFGNTAIPGVDATSGSLGHGIGVIAGIAMSARNRGVTRRHYVIVSEGEFYEGSTWEGLLFLNHHGLKDVTVIVDINDLIILGGTDSCLALNSLKSKLDGFDFELFEVDGHNVGELIAAFSRKVARPKIILCKTVKGKGFSLMENKGNWHYWNPLSDDEIEQCRREIS